MYTQGLDQKSSQKAQPTAIESAEDNARFQAHIDAEEKIEPKDWICSPRSRTKPVMGSICIALRKLSEFRESR